MSKNLQTVTKKIQLFMLLLNLFSSGDRTRFNNSYISGTIQGDTISINNHIITNNMTVKHNLSYYKNHLYQLYFEKSESEMMDVGIGRRMDGRPSRRKTRKARMSSAGSRIMKVDLKEPSWEEEGLY